MHRLSVDILQAVKSVPEVARRGERNIPVLRVDAGGEEGGDREGARAGVQQQAGGAQRVQPEGTRNRRQNLPGISRVIYLFIWSVYPSLFR